MFDSVEGGAARMRSASKKKVAKKVTKKPSTVRKTTVRRKTTTLTTGAKPLKRRVVKRKTVTTTVTRKPVKKVKRRTGGAKGEHTLLELQKMARKLKVSLSKGGVRRTKTSLLRAITRAQTAK